MTKSKLTREELNAAAMLMGDGWWYDHNDHTFNARRGGVQTLDADTLQPIDFGGGIAFSNSIYDRSLKVQRGELGCADGPFSNTGGNYR